MLRALTRKGLADLRSRPLQSSLLFLIVALAAATAMMAVTVHSSASEPFESLVNDANGGHVWLFDPSDDILAAAADDDLVEGFSGPFDRANGTLVEGEDAYPLLFFAIPAEEPEVRLADVTRGRWLSDAPNEIVIDSGLAKEAGLGLGDSVEVATGTGTVTFEVVGIAAGMVRPPYPIWDPAAVYVTPDTLASFVPDPQLSAVVGVHLIDGSLTDPFLASMREVGPVANTRWQDLRQSFDDDAMLTVVILSSFAVFALRI